MWLLVFIFLAVTVFLGWILFGYFIFMFIVGVLQKKPPVQLVDDLPGISLIVPCFNEEKDIVVKVQNLKALNYPSDRLEVIFVDGGSSDQTVALIKENIKGTHNYRVAVSPKGGKINQINFVMPGLKNEIVVNTDVDSKLDPDVLKWIVSEFNSGKDVGVVGAYCSPENSVEVEGYYWSAQNRGRFIESDANSSSIAIAQCYGFKKDLIPFFPEDVVADDIYVSFRANSLGFRTIYSRKAKAVETRSPVDHREFLYHKFRKSNAFLRESLRFLYLIPEMNSFFKLTFMTRLAQQSAFLPWSILLWILVAGALLTMFRYDIVLFGTLLLFILFAATSNIFSLIKLPEEKRSYSLATVILGYVLTNFIMIATALSYPFYRQNSSYSRLRSGDENTNK